MRCRRERYEEFGFRGLFDRRRGKPSPKRVAMTTVERVLELYRERYFDLNVWHLHEKLAREHQIELSYSCAERPALALYSQRIGVIMNFWKKLVGVMRVHHFGQNRSWSVAVGIIVCLCTLGLGSNVFALPDSVSQLIKKLKDKKTEVRVQAAMELGRIRDPRAVEPLIAALQDKDGAVRGSAAMALGFSEDPRAVEPLIAALKDKDDSVKSSAATALGSSKDPRAVEPLIAALGDTNYRVRDSAVFALGRIENRRAVEPLIAALQDRDPEVRSSAAQALERMNDPRAAEPLQRFAADSVAKTRSEYVIAELKPSCPGGVLASSADITIEAIGPGSSYVKTSGRLEYLPNGQSLAWCSGARHTIKGRLETAGYTFISDPTDPLVFRESDRGYVYERGKGIVITPSNETVLLQLK